MGVGARRTCTPAVNCAVQARRAPVGRETPRTQQVAVAKQRKTVSTLQASSFPPIT